MEGLCLVCHVADMVVKLLHEAKETLEFFSI